MNAHIKLPKAMQAEIDRQKEKIFTEVYEKATAEITAQILATVFWTMSVEFGWGEKRLRALADALHDTEHLMINPSRLHHRFCGLDCEEYLKSKYGIDLRKEFKGEIIYK